jgi:hypothetical protein
LAEAGQRIAVALAEGGQACPEGADAALRRTMKRPLWLGVMFLSFALAMLEGSRDSGSQARDRDRFVGAWRLVWLEEPDADGNVHRADCTGMLVFTGDGHMSVQVMYRNPARTSASPVQYAQGGYEASFGRYEIDERAHTFTLDVEGALVRSLINQHLTRVYELSGTQLIVRPASPNEHWRVAWEKR